MFQIDSAKIRNLIFASGLTLKQFALKVGLNERTTGKLTRDGATATAKTISTLAKFFNVDGNDLILTEKE